MLKARVHCSRIHIMAETWIREFVANVVADRFKTTYGDIELKQVSKCFRCALEELWEIAVWYRNISSMQSSRYVYDTLAGRTLTDKYEHRIAWNTDLIASHPEVCFSNNRRVSTPFWKLKTVKLDYFAFSSFHCCKSASTSQWTCYILRYFAPAVWKRFTDYYFTEFADAGH